MNYWTIPSRNDAIPANKAAAWFWCVYLASLAAGIALVVASWLK